MSELLLAETIYEFGK